MAVGAFVLFCIAVLAKATKLLEPDDSAYLASIIALTHGHITLSTAQYDALSAQLSAHYGTGIMQWIHLSDGRWMSEKNPGYPFFAAPLTRATPSSLHRSRCWESCGRHRCSQAQWHRSASSSPAVAGWGTGAAPGP
ncbi:MAG: hypothetical protein ABSF27_10035 [Candidatus Dormibacteria bacterium]